MISVRDLVGTHDVLFITLDTLRYDVASRLWKKGRTPNLGSLLPPDGWEERHSPGNFTYAAHHSFFAGFLPTPSLPGKHARPFAVRFGGSGSISDRTAVFDTPDIVSGFASRGYRTICIGGVGFFNKGTPLGAVLPGLFQESYWSPRFGVNDLKSAEHQVREALRVLAALPRDRRVFLFINISAIHEPNRGYLPGAEEDSIETHAAALEYVDQSLGPLLEEMPKRAPVFGIVCSDHGTAYGEGGFRGHRISLPVVWNVPYAEFLLEGPAK